MKDFTEGNILTQLVDFSVPMFLANLLQALYGIIDAVWVGNLLGHQAFAAVSTSLPVIFLLVSAVIGLTVATNILAGQAFGSKNNDYLSRVLTNSFISTGTLCLIISICGVLMSKIFIEILNVPQEIRSQAHIFLVISISGILLTFMYNWFSAILRGLGDAKTPLKLLVISLLLNIIIVPVLITGLGPLPALGIAGSALGTVLSNTIMIFISYFLFLKKHPVLNIRKWDFKIDFKIIKQIFRIGIPSSIQMIFVSLSGVFIMSIVNSFGSKITAAAGIGMQIDQISVMPSMAIGMAVSSMVAQNLGAYKYDRVKKILEYSVVFGLLSALLSFIIVYSVPDKIISIFTREKEVIKYAIEYLRIVSFSYFTFSIVFILQGVVRGAGDTTVMLVFTLIALVFFRYPFAYFLAKFTYLSQKGIWIAILVSTFVGFFLNYWYYVSGKWKKTIVK